MPESCCDFFEQGYAERYVLNELTARTRDRYEEHLFSCAACADEARAAVTFSAGVREIYRDRMVNEQRFYGAVAALLAGTDLALLCWPRQR